GRNDYGQLGIGDTKNRGDDPGEMGDNLPAVDLGTGLTVTAITTGYYHTCAMLSNGSAKCWGYNFYGQLGLGDTVSRGDNSGEMGDNLPVVDVGLDAIIAEIIAGGSHTCALLVGGSFKCWGYNFYGQLGLGHVAPLGNDPGEMGNNLPVVDL